MRELLNTLYAMTPGTSLHLDGDAVRVVRPDSSRRNLLPLARIDHIVVFGGVTATDELVCRVGGDGKTVTWLTGPGRLLATAAGGVRANPHLRLAQYRAHDDQGRRIELARWFVAGKLQNTRQLLLRAARDTEGARAERLRATAERVAERLPQLLTAISVEAILGLEGLTAREYVQRWPDLISAHADVDVPRHRVTRPATDPLNSALNFGYALLRIATAGALETVGLDPFIGYLHGVRPAKPALALDVMEEFRALLVDRLVFTAFNRRQLTARHFTTTPNGVVELSDDGRKTIIAMWSEARRKEWPHPLFRNGVPGALLPLVQARMLARYLRGDVDTYLSWSPDHGSARHLRH